MQKGGVVGSRKQTRVTALLCISSLLVWRLVVRLHSRCRVWGEAEEWVAKVERVVKEKGRGECRQDENFSRELI